MILSDRDLRARLQHGDLEVGPLSDPELQIQPASIDLRLSNRFVVYKLPHVPCIDARDPADLDRYTTVVDIPDGDAFIMHPGEFALGSTVEVVRIPSDLVARVGGHRPHVALGRALLRAVGDVDAASGLLLGLHRLDEYVSVHGLQVHLHISPWVVG